jgi:hypothetical protein
VLRCTVRAVEWVGDAQIQIGAYEAPPPAQVAPFLAGFVDGLATHAAVREAELVEVDAFNAADSSNPTRHVSFRFLAESQQAAERLASDELRDIGMRGGMEALDPSLRQFGWAVSIDVNPT